MQAHQPYFDEIAAGGDAIGNWLSGDVSGPAALDALMARFAPHFTMIGTDGAAYDRAATRAPLDRRVRARPADGRGALDASAGDVLRGVNRPRRCVRAAPTPHAVRVSTRAAARRPGTPAPGSRRHAPVRQGPIDRR